MTSLIQLFSDTAETLFTTFNEFITVCTVKRITDSSYDPISGIVVDTTESIEFLGVLLDVNSTDLKENSSLNLSLTDKKILVTNFTLVLTTNDIISITGVEFILLAVPINITTTSKILTKMFIRATV